MKIYYNLVFCLGLLALLIAVSGPSHAEKVTPSDVYEKTELFRLRLDAMGLLDLAAYEAEQVDAALRHPRHVMQKVRKCHMLLSHILEEKEQMPTPMPLLLSAREIRPSDVKKSVEHLLTELDKIGAPATVNVPAFQNKLPDDVYSNLHRTCRAMKSEIDHEDVYSVALALRNDLKKIAAARGYEIQSGTNDSSTVTKATLYNDIKAMLENLRTLALNPDYAIPGGVVISKNVSRDDVSLKDVLGLLDDAIAETGAIKYSLHIGEKGFLPEPEREVFLNGIAELVYEADQIILELIELERIADQEEE